MYKFNIKYKSYPLSLALLLTKALMHSLFRYLFTRVFYSSHNKARLSKLIPFPELGSFTHQSSHIFTISLFFSPAFNNSHFLKLAFILRMWLSCFTSHKQIYIFVNNLFQFLGSGTNN